MSRRFAHRSFGATAVAAALALLLAACSSQSPSVAVTGPPSGSGAPSTGASAAPTVAPTADTILPAGIEFGDQTSLPGDFGAVFGDLDGRHVFFGRQHGFPAAGTLDGSTWTVVPLDKEAGYVLPAGTKRTKAADGSGTLRLAVSGTASRNGVLVAVGSGNVEGAGGAYIGVGLVWRTTDGAAWDRFDPRDVLGGRDLAVNVQAVTATSDGFVAIGSYAPLGSKDPARIFVLRSSDGRSWSLAGTIAHRWSIGAQRVWDDGSRLVLEGQESVCGAVGSGMLATGSARAARLWTSPDRGTTWTEADLTPASPALVTKEAAPTDAAACPKASDYQALLDRFSTKGSILGVADGHVVALSNDGGTIATSSSDLATWTSSPLPGGVASSGRSPGSTPSGPVARLLTSDGSGWIVRTLQPHRDATDAQLPVGCDIRWWRSTDQGTTWAPGIAGRPVRSCAGGFFYLVPAQDGSIFFFGLEAPVHPPPLRGGFRQSASGPVSDWSTCAPSPASDCSFVTMDGIGGGASPSWSKIDLTGANLTHAALAGADLGEANLAGARIDGDLSGAKLTGAYLGYARITGTLAGADLTGAQVFQAVFGGDLTGVTFGDSYLTQVTFLPGTTCPDGKPSTDAPDKAACRLP